MNESSKIEKAIDLFTNEMKKKMIKRLDDEYKGWDSRGLMPDFELMCRMYDKILKTPIEDSIDIANYAMMLWYRNMIN